ncbi:ATP-binding cassette domain-containing protein [Desulfobulbus alkaliphilus]|uniref:ATP-binding cassette domain-containing protein n=1 Tax=Desulfobulbus alkaliphilus TaxID=869814 RepID=UPI0019629196|nr:ATP-binding cassette domain-containing protein [Desulfobulbus alkaliphilus]MBM9536732.1 ATP-binding cassette domain-containing protein [Desulfobulbus alkaliphilus]
MIEIQCISAPGLQVDRFMATADQAWCFIGSNASGIDILCDVLSGEDVGVQADVLRLPSDLGVVSFKRQQALFEEELRRDDSDFLDRIDPGTRAGDFVTEREQHRELIDLFALGNLLDRGYRQLSSGESRKLCLLQQVTRAVSCLLIENPYEGLDHAGCRDLDSTLARLRGHGTALLVFVSNTCDIPPWCSHLAVLDQGVLVLQGPVVEVHAAACSLLKRQAPLFQASVTVIGGERPATSTKPPGTNLVTLRHGFARYGDVAVFADLDLEINKGDHTFISGPNGCGKSTLLQIITGDNPLCYVNDLTLFGQRRGCGESIWDIKKHLGIVSHDLHRNHRMVGTALTVVLSGLFDSIGLYAQPTHAQLDLGRRWLQRLSLAAKEKTPFRQLGYGEQRLILLGRALIKMPPLLILDEPTQGLDEKNRHALLDFLEDIAREGLSTILYVSHRQDEDRDFFRQKVCFS